MTARTLNARCWVFVGFSVWLASQNASTGIAGDVSAASARDANHILGSAGVRGGFVVHVGCGDGTLPAALHANDSFLVHGLDADPANVAKAREHIRSLGLYGKVAADQLNGASLPYVDNSVNLVVVEDPACGIGEDEILRVLVPGGVGLVLNRRSEIANSRCVKPWPKEIDEWSHYLHGPDNNAVAHDRVVASPFHVQWVGGPKWARHHNHLCSLSAMVSSGGRLFAIVDEGPTASINLPPQWFLVARDAFNGVVLWKKPVGPWEGHLRPFRSGPTELSRRLVAVGDRVYVTLGYGAPLTALDAATGRIVRTYSDTEGTVEIACRDGVLYVVVGRLDRQQYAASAFRGSASPHPHHKQIRAIGAEWGQTKWTKCDEDTCELLPTTVCAGDDRVFFHSPGSVLCLDASTGKELWRTTTAQGYNAPADVFVADGLVWTSTVPNGASTDFTEGRDLHTGEVKRTLDTAAAFTTTHHHRCYRDKATDRFILLGRTGTELIDLAGGRPLRHCWVRGSCQYGVMPANGLLYAPPHARACYIQSKLSGLWALAPRKETKDEGGRAKGEPRLQRGRRTAKFSRQPTPGNRQANHGQPIDTTPPAAVTQSPP